MTEIHDAPDGVLDVFALASRLSTGHTADNVEALNQLDPDDAAAVLLLLPLDVSIEILDSPNSISVRGLSRRCRAIQPS